MEMKTFQIIKNIATLDYEMLPVVFLELEKTVSHLLGILDILSDNDSEIEECLQSVGLLLDGTYSRNLLSLCGFEESDEIASGYFDNYCDSEEINKMDTLKKELIEWAIELEELEKNGLC